MTTPFWMSQHATALAELNGNDAHDDAQGIIRSVASATTSSSTATFSPSSPRHPALRRAGQQRDSLPYNIPTPAVGSRPGSRAPSIHVVMPDPSFAMPSRVRTERDMEQILVDPFRAPSIVLIWRSLVIWQIWSQLLLIGLWTSAIVVLDDQIEGLHLSLSTTLLTIIGTVIGFVISYRTSSAYERYGEGRRYWSSVILATRTLGRIFWLHCPNERKPRGPDDGPVPEEEALMCMLEKKTAINLLEGFAVALKHYLRGEHGIYYTDLYHIACFLPKYSIPSSIPGQPGGRADIGHNDAHVSHDSLADKTAVDGDDVETMAEVSTHNPSSTIQRKAVPRSTRSDSGIAQNLVGLHDPFHPPQPLAPAYNPPQYSVGDRFVVVGILRSLWKGTRNATGRRRRRRRYERHIHDDNIPLEIVIYLDSFIACLQRRKSVDAPTISAAFVAILSLSDSMTSLERILTTPLPFGYSTHLKVVIWGYLLFLPFQLINTFGYITIPAVVLVSFAFLGFLHIGQTIEDPFGYDQNDLDLDHFCRNIISRELSEITSWPVPDPEEFVFSRSNLPLLPRDSRSALEISKSQVTVSELQRALRQREFRNGPLPV